MYFYSRNNFINCFSIVYCYIVYFLLLYSIFSISFIQEEPIHNFLHLNRIRSKDHHRLTRCRSIDHLHSEIEMIQVEDRLNFFLCNI